MFTIDEIIFNKILKKKFSSLVGTSCESIEDIFKDKFDNVKTEFKIKKTLKKSVYDTMREIEEQISAFNKGVNINIKFNKPISE